MGQEKKTFPSWFNLNVKVEEVEERVKIIEETGGGGTSINYVPENQANKQNSLSTDGTATKFPTVDAVNVFKTATNNSLSTLASDLLSKLPKGTYTGTASDLETSILAISTGVQGVAITPTSTPTGTGVASWLVAESGTYTNFGGVILPVNHIGFIIRSASNVYSITSMELDLTDYLLKSKFDELEVVPSGVSVQKIGNNVSAGNANAVTNSMFANNIQATTSGVVRSVNIQATSAGVLGLRVFIKNGANYDYVSGQNITVVSGVNNITGLNISMPIGGYLGIYVPQTGSNLRYDTGTSNPKPYIYILGSDIIGNNVVLSTTTSQNGLMYNYDLESTSSHAYIPEKSIDPALIARIDTSLSNSTNLECIRNFNILPIGWISSGWTFGSNKATSGGTGLSNQLRTNKAYGIDSRVVKWEFEITVSASIITFLTNPIEGGINSGSAIKLDSSLNTLSILNAYTGSNNPTTIVSIPLGFTIVTGNRYILEWHKKQRGFYVKIWCAQDSLNDVFEYERLASPWGYSSYPSYGYDQGNMQGSPSVAVNFGAVEIHSFEHICNCNSKPILYMIGDSITEHFGVPDKFTLTSLLRDNLGEKNVVSSGVGGAVTAGALSRMQSELINIRPKWVLIYLGSNSDGAFTTNIPTMVSFAQSIGAKVIVSTVPTNPTYTSFLNSLPSNVKKVDWATELTVGGAGTSRVTSYYANTDGVGISYNDNLHPNSLGELKRFRRLLLDIPELLI
jgi:lysophospholipase L1-like esterase